MIESDDEDENMTWETRNRPIKAMPARARANTSFSKNHRHRVGRVKRKQRKLITMVTCSNIYLRLFMTKLTRLKQSLIDRSASFSVVHSEVITIEDEDEDDKENVPTPSRHVRPRRGGSLINVAPDDYLELLDSD
ncbi:hypothetical protein DFH05DRAFT_1464680 [Lentinula detonsa]|uniref:Uncharacterized protein n=1 Tax=Lentinula detonsa TaxID=2804962 RepID=A0A9W8NPW3_9AGAR|nr:hypothetical protein DFH05DRAFT_1464680 [Lentinula detonsa]